MAYLAGTWALFHFELVQAILLAISILITLVDASAERYSVSIDTFIPVIILIFVLNEFQNFPKVNFKILTEHWQISFWQSEQPAGQSNSHGQAEGLKIDSKSLRLEEITLDTSSLFTATFRKTISIGRFTFCEAVYQLFDTYFNADSIKIIVAEVFSTFKRNNGKAGLHHRTYGQLGSTLTQRAKPIRGKSLRRILR